jgi:hypothetical protein
MIIGLNGKQKRMTSSLSLGSASDWPSWNQSLRVMGGMPNEGTKTVKSSSRQLATVGGAKGEAPLRRSGRPAEEV